MVFRLTGDDTQIYLTKDKAERKDELGTDQVAVPERRLRELTHPVARQQRP